ncbi:sugar ABC transporter substrate-binding protein [Streptomyces sp. SID9913]|uniref:Sugar ABC transporter substrate-binding protein n=2 Tax=unclassified Streptomyces TaxID=2593676 RepID=A0A6G3QWJ8_9ACTN|nr:sugar ABC transporter substrate-binding protein [Streptomyces sp. SID14436]NEC80442.1 sugar ABC transporter substrate-binding protein [Streptomyces sp. SID7958]NED21614.1 sugar ABC transporter substrate-binding protein [Streptomyces sp. SID9913]
MNPRTTRTTRTARTPAVARRTARVLTAAACTLSLSACGVLGAAGPDGDASPTHDGEMTVGLLLPDKDTARFEKFDHPLIKERVAALTDGKGKVVYANAEGSSEKQSEQFGKLIADGVDVIVVNAVDAEAVAADVRRAKDADIPVIAYDRLAEGPIDAFVSHDNELVGEVQGRAVLDALGEEAEAEKVVMMNGAPADPNTALFKKGALAELDGKVDIVARYDTRKWLPKVAKENMREAIEKVGAADIAAVYSANDGMAGAVIEALKEAGVAELPPVTGQDADLAAVRRIVSGEQYMTVYKSFLLEASGAAEIAVARVQDRSIQFDALARDRVDSPTRKDIPAMLVPVVAVTKDNIKDTVILDKVYTAEEICTAQYAQACESVDLTP